MTPGTVLITGATGAIGGALALAYAAPGRTLVLHGRNSARLKDVARACEARGASTEMRVLDVRDIAALRSWLTETTVRQPVDLAIANAGTINVLRPGDADEAWPDAERVLDVNVRATLATIAALLPHMRSRGSGQIAIMSSLSAWCGIPVAPAYSASKAALKAYGETLLRPLAAEGIRVNIVLPGFVKSDMSDRLQIPKPFMISAENAARRIKKGLEANRARISFPLPLAFGCRLLSALPPRAHQRILVLLGYNRR